MATLLSNTTRLRASADSAILSDRYLLRAVQLERLIVDVETGLRGYLVTGHREFLAPLYSAEARLPAAETAPAQTASQDGDFRSQAAALTAAARFYVSGYVARDLTLADHDLAAARSLTLTRAGKADVDHIRALSASLHGAVANRQAARQRSAHDQADQSIVEAIILLVLLTALTLVLGGYLGRLAVSRERARKLAEQTVVTLQRSILPARILSLARGDALLAFTDGVTDQGTEREAAPESALTGLKPGATAEDLAEALVDFAHETPGDQHDDIAIVALRFLGAPAAGVEGPSGSTFSAAPADVDIAAPVVL